MKRQQALIHETDRSSSVVPALTAQPHRLPVFHALLLATVAAGVFFAALNGIDGRATLATAELIMVGYSLVVLMRVGQSDRPERWIFAYLITFFGVMMLALTTRHDTSTVYAWVLLIPILSHFLLGRWTGSGVAAFFMGTAAVIFFWQYRADPEFTGVTAIANMTISASVIFLLSHIYELSRERTEQRLRSLALTDSLTGLANRTRFRDIFEREREVAHREGKTMAILVADLDHFKQVKDTYGHDAGDAALRFVANLMRLRLQATDLPCRMGGEEFGIMLTNTTAEQAQLVAEDLRLGLEQAPFRYHGFERQLTMSLGVAVLGRDGDDLQSLFSAADRRLYRSKAEGRNQVTGPEPEPPGTNRTWPKARRA